MKVHDRSRARATAAFEHIDRHDEKLRTQVLQAASLVRSAGACQALHFLEVRPDDAARFVLDALAEDVLPRLGRAGKRAELLKLAREAEFDVYLHLTRELLAVLAWYRRAAQAQKVDADLQSAGAGR